MIVSFVVYENGIRVPDVSFENLYESTIQPNRMVWIGLCDPEEAELQQIAKRFKLHELAVQDAMHGGQRPKVEEYGDMIFVVMDLLEMDEQKKVNKGEASFFAGPNFVISVRRNSKFGFSDVRARCEREPHMLRLGPGFVLYALMDAVVDRYFPVLTSLEDQMEEQESRVFLSTACRKSIQALFTLKQDTNRLRHSVAEIAESTGRMHGPRAHPICVRCADYFRDVADHLFRIQTATENIRESINTVIQVNLSLITIDESDITKKLASWAAIFAVVAAYAGIWGMNFEDMPELKWPYGYGVALAIILVTCLYLYRRFKRKGWL